MEHFQPPKQDFVIPVNSLSFTSQHGRQTTEHIGDVLPIRNVCEGVALTRYMKIPRKVKSDPSLLQRHRRTNITRHEFKLSRLSPMSRVIRHFSWRLVPLKGLCFHQTGQVWRVLSTQKVTIHTRREKQAESRWRLWPLAFARTEMTWRS